MTPVEIGILGIIFLLILLSLRIPVGIAMLIVALTGYSLIVSPSGALSKFGGDVFVSTRHYTLSVIPLFVLMGMFLTKANLGGDLYQFIDGFLGRIRGGMAMATIVAGAAFGAVCGSVIASASTISTVAVPEMRKYNYDIGLATSVSAVGSTLGVVIPPSTALVLYGVLTEEPIGRILIAGILPGIMTMFLLMVTVYLLLLWKPHLAPPKRVKEGTPFAWEKIKFVWAIPLIFFLSIGGIYGGIFTPTEAGGVGAFLSMLTALATGRLRVKQFSDAVSHSVRITAMVFLIIIGGKMFGAFLTITRIPLALTSAIQQMDIAPFTVVFIIFIVFFIMGVFMDELATLVIMTPIVYPIIISLGYDGVWFGVLTIMMLLSGLLTPPVGIVSLVVASITKVPAAKVFAAQVPFWITLLIAALLVAIFPGIALFLPQLMW